MKRKISTYNWQDFVSRIKKGSSLFSFLVANPISAFAETNNTAKRKYGSIKVTLQLRRAILSKKYLTNIIKSNCSLNASLIRNYDKKLIYTST